MLSFHQALSLRLSESIPSADDHASTTIESPFSTVTTPNAYTKRTVEPPAAPTKRIAKVSFYNESSVEPADFCSAEGVARNQEYKKIVVSIVDLNEAHWFSEGSTAVFKESLRSRQGAEELQRMLIQAFEVASQAQLLYAKILRKYPPLDPDSQAFRIFKTLALATLLSDDASLAGRLKADLLACDEHDCRMAQEWIDEVAKDAEGLIEDIKIACDQDDKYQLGEDFSLRECLLVMSHHFEHNYVRLCKIYPEYSKIPKIALDEGNMVQRGGETGAKAERNVEIDDVVMIELEPVPMRSHESPRLFSSDDEFYDADCGTELDDNGFCTEDDTPTRKPSTRSRSLKSPNFSNGEEFRKATVSEGKLSYHGRPIRDRHARKLKYDDIIKGDAVTLGY